MKTKTQTRTNIILANAAIWAAFYLVIFAITSFGQAARETYTGTILSYGSGRNTRTQTAPFTLRITGETSDAQAQRFLGRLASGGQDDLLRAIGDESLGRFSSGAIVGRQLNVVLQENVGGRLRIYAIFERWMQFAEIRGGYRSTDYPFGFVELYIDPRTGRGEGTYIAAARIRSRKNEGGRYIEVEDFATYPARLLNVRSTRRAN